ncbi:UDP-N-acetyl-D-mannosamine dehydrogenase [Corynebacterium casei]|uniref:UDP-N-acetyl-D-mannosamine dehydrogenase n=1 Tax=Corynebacterium casei TaxID=160386 RepID=UPI003FD6144F
MSKLKEIVSAETTVMKPEVCVIGLGYIGLPTAAFFAAEGVDVLGVDTNTKHVEQINGGNAPFVEPGFDSLLSKVVGDGYLRAATKPESAGSYIICVPTPFNTDYSVNMEYIESAVQSFVDLLEPENLVVLESTSPPGTTEKVYAQIVASRPDLRDRVFVAHCPERVLPGKIMEELKHNDRVIGGITANGAEKAKSLYSRFCQGEMLLTDARTAEMAKLTENSFRDVNIAFANELHLICDQLGINVWELISLANHHPRVNILQPGPGVGGHCIAVDPWFIVSSAPETARIIRTAREVNDAKPSFVIGKMNEIASDLTEAPRIAVLGLAFKADIDDLRQSPAVQIVKEFSLANPRAELLVVEPNIKELPVFLHDTNSSLVPLEAALSEANAFVLLVDHKEFKSVAQNEFGERPVIDMKGIWNCK